jgi:hypothetical protein
MAHHSYLLGQQTGKGSAIRHLVVIAVLLMRQQRIRRLPRNLRIKVVLL